MTATAMPSAKAQFLDTFDREHRTTMKVLRAYPSDKASLQPHEMCKTAVGLAGIFAGEMGMLHTGLTTGFDWSRPPQFPKMPDSMDDVIALFDRMHQQVVADVNGLTDAQLVTETVEFPSGPGQMGHPTKLEFLWFVLCDQIHHRGQFSIYLRMAGGKVPSIYGPSADEPWM